MSAHVLLILLNELGKRDKMRGLPSILSLFCNEIMVTLDFIFRLVHCSSEDVSFSIICLNVFEGIKQFYLLMWFKKTRLEAPFKGDNVKA